jgi:hypothetical protein
MHEKGIDSQIPRPPQLSEQSQRIEQVVKEVLPGCNQWKQWYGCIEEPGVGFRNMWWQIVVEKMGTHEQCKLLSQQWAGRFDGYIRTFQMKIEQMHTDNQPSGQQP